MIKIAVIDDEPQMQKAIENCISDFVREEHKKEIEVRMYSSANEFLNLVSEQEGMIPDILFTDIQMQDMDGVELGKTMRKLCPNLYIVFITAYENYAVESYKMEAYQYILKEDMEYRLPPVIQQLVEKVERERKEFLIIKNGIEKVKVYYKDIIYIYKSKGTKYVNYVTTSGVLRERSSLEQVETKIQSQGGSMFLYVERGYVVNMKQISRISGSSIYLENGCEVQVSRAKLAEVKRAINHFWREN